MKTNYFTETNPINYEAIASDSSKHLRYRDYKHLKDVTWSYGESNLDKSIVISDILGLTGFILAIVSIIAVLYLGV